MFIISIQDDALISAAVTSHALSLCNLIHSVQTVVLSIIKSFKFNIISITLSFIHGIVVYSWLIHFILIHVTFDQGILDNNILLSELPIVIPYHLGSGQTVNLEVFKPTSCSKILGTQISLCMICILFGIIKINLYYLE